jgi:preprotein translocase subunit SecF
MSPERILPGSAGGGAPEEPTEPTTEPRSTGAVDAAPSDLEPIAPDRPDAGASAGADVPDDAPAAAATAKSHGANAWAAEASEGDDGAILGGESEPILTGEEGVRRHGHFGRIYYGETRIDFVRRRKIWFAISILVILAGGISLGVRGLNYGIDFVGGTSWTVPSKTVSLAQANAAVAGTIANPQTTVLGVYGSSSRTIDVEARLPQGETAADQATIATQVATKLAHLTHQSVNNVEIESVGPSWGSQITDKALQALVVFFILIALYISVFFEWRMALAAIIAVLHDIAVTVGIYSLSGFEVTPDTVVAFLTILGYSLYDTIVVFDRVRDNTRHLTIRDRLTFSDVVNLSMNQTLARSINTSLVAIMPILAMLVLGADILGATTLQYFGLALLVGLTTGAYSSIFIASPLVAIMKEREPKYRIIRERLVARGGGRVLLSASAVASGTYGDTFESRTTASAPRTSSRPRAANARTGTQPNTSRPTPRRSSSRAKPKGGRR